MGKCSPTKVKENTKKIKAIPGKSGNWESLTVLTKSQKLQVIKELFLSLDHAGKITCWNEILFEEKSELSRMILSLLQSILAKEKKTWKK